MTKPKIRSMLFVIVPMLLYKVLILWMIYVMNGHVNSGSKAVAAWIWFVLVNMLDNPVTSGNGWVDKPMAHNSVHT